MIVMISEIAFDRPDSLSHLRAFPDHFKIYTILPIVHIKLNSIQVINRGRSSQSFGSFGIVWLAFSYDCPDRLNIIILRHLGESQHSQNVSMTVLSWTDIIREKL